jgi:hypothetical protein
VPRRVRQGEDQLVLDQIAHRHFPAGNDPVCPKRIGGLGMDLCQGFGEDQNFVCLHIVGQSFQAALATQLQGAPHSHSQAGTAALVVHSLDFVFDFPFVRGEHVAQARKAAHRPHSLLACPGGRELETVDDRLRLRHKGAG